MHERLGAWRLRPADIGDAGWLADLKATTMQADLERVGYWDRDWARQRFLDTFVVANTRVVVLQGREVGCVAVREEHDAYWLEHFYLDASVQGQGVGGGVLARVLAEHDDKPFRLAIDRGSAVQRLYERHGFVYLRDADDNPVDQVFERPRGVGGALSS